MNRALNVLELAKYRSRPPEKPEPGEQPAAITYYSSPRTASQVAYDILAESMRGMRDARERKDA